MATRTRTRRSLWRWRRNPLRRREDLIEGWVLLAAWTVVAVGGPLAGAASGQATADSLAQQRTDRHPVTATFAGDAQRRVDRFGSAGDRVLGTVRWTAPDGTGRTGRTLVDGGLQPGARLVVWVDGHQRITVQPPTPAQATTQAAATGVTAALAVGGIAAGGYYAVHAALDRRRGRAWEAEWEKVGPQWGRTTH
ncbi:Rv1733c family protein [Streptomyces tropicalis]|uniref:Membrane protein SCJ1.26 n=1 Tax=Streptomyces tropicalis TaxID=3034234 RepID=A0ABT6AA37_9ACTN|nr:hypothetical protein [Streptomyces tropicalis]MDF3301508.1 hypothetical protein [Streptomyces tropicalis]